jgi:tRNA-dihydrouridine synthase
MGFDGIDINMGCPDNDVAKRGGGAALIRNPKLAKEIIFAVVKGVNDWSQGITLEKAGISPDSIQFIEDFITKNSIQEKRVGIPVSVKTRIGFDSIVIEEWVKHLLETPISNISIHGRTLKQMYTGLADWEAIGRAAEIIKQTDVTVLGNGDIKSLEEAHQKVTHYCLDGVLVGRATFGNPYFFDSTSNELTLNQRLDFCLEHADYYTKVLKDKPFIALRKHMAWYCKGFENASELRSKLVRVNTVEDINTIYHEYNK